MKEKCISCETIINFVDKSYILNCNNCNVLNYDFNKIIMNIEDLESDRNILENLSTLYSQKEFESILKVTNNLIIEIPKSVTYKVFHGISLFWIGYSNFNHLGESITFLINAKNILKEDKFINILFEAFTSKIVYFATKNKIFGDQLTESLNAIELVKKYLIINQDNQKLLDSYLYKVFKNYNNNFNELVLRNKKNFDPPYLAINNLLKSTEYSSFNEELFSFSYLYSKFHLDKNKRKSYSEELSVRIKNLENLLIINKSNVVGQRLYFNFFGQLKLSK